MFPALLGIMSVVMLKKMSLQCHPNVIYVIEGVNMMIVNVFLLSIVHGAQHTGKNGALLLAVFAIDTMHGIEKI